MSRKILINILENVFPPSVNQAIIKDLLGKEGKTTTLVAETTIALNFANFASHTLQLNTQNVTLNATVTGLKDGEIIILKTIQDNVAARTITWGSNIVNPFGVSITLTVDAVDYFLGIVSGGSIILLAFKPNADTLVTDVVSEKTVGNGVAVDSVKLKDGWVYIDNGIVAAAGSAQGDAGAIVNLETIVTGADGAKGVVLPAVVDNLIITVHNVTANQGLKIYPASGEKINGGTVNVAVIITSAASDTSALRFMKKAAGDWYSSTLRGTLS